MHHPQHNAARSDTTDSSYSRHYPDHEPSLASIISSAGLHGDIDTGTQIPGNYEASIETTALPCMCHGKCSQLTAHETVTQSHGPQCQYHTWDSAIDSSLSRLFDKPSCASLDCTNSYLAPSAQPKLTSITYQDQYDALAINIAQMQSNSYHTFAPSGSRGFDMSAQFMDSPFIEHRDLTIRSALKPQSSHISTPNSVYAKPLQSQDFEHAYRGIKTSSSTTDSKETMQFAEKVVSTPQLHSGVEVYNTPKRETNNPYVHDWLSSSQDHNENQSLQVAQDQQQTLSLDDPSLSPSYIAPDLFVTNSGGNLPSGQTFPQYDNGINQQNFTGMFAANTTDNSFVLNSTSNNNLNDRLYTDSNSFAAGIGQYLYPHQSHPFLAGFDFNNSPLYPADHYVTGHSPYDVPQPASTLLTQHGQVHPTGKQSNKIRAGDRAELDENLVKWRAQGITYKEIMEMGDWDLKESTLRGRYRTLTKPKEERLRKPRWDNAALSALVAGVDHLAPPAANSRRTTEDLGKVPWKKVTEWMQREKGCYPYGYHTIKKKYKELLSNRQMQREVNQWRRAHGEHPL